MLREEGGANMANQNKQASKAAVQSDKYNKMPVPGVDDTEFSAEEAAEVFEENQSAENNTAEEQE